MLSDNPSSLTAFLSPAILSFWVSTIEGVPLIILFKIKILSFPLSYGYVRVYIKRAKSN